jgi:hypothetical protein
MKILAILFSFTLFASFAANCDRSTPPEVPTRTITVKSASDGPVTGEWSGNFKVMTFTVPVTLNLILEGSINSDHTGAGTVSKGSFADNKISFTADFTKHESIALTGTLADGKITGEFTTEGHTGTWEVTRK